MKKIAAACVLAFALAPTACTHPARADGPSLRPADLRCEYRKDPLGIDEARPRLSWSLEAMDPGARGLAQGSYRILAASSPDQGHDS